MTLTKLKRHGENILALTWSDGQTTYITLQKLRDECPCASCKGETVLFESHRPTKLPVFVPGMYDLKKLMWSAIIPFSRTGATDIKRVYTPSTTCVQSPHLLYLNKVAKAYALRAFRTSCYFPWCNGYNANAVSTVLQHLKKEFGYESAP